MRWAVHGRATFVGLCACACVVNGGFILPGAADTSGGFGGVTAASSEGSDDGPISTVFSTYPDTSPSTTAIDDAAVDTTDSTTSSGSSDDSIGDPASSSGSSGDAEPSSSSITTGDPASSSGPSDDRGSSTTEGECVPPDESCTIAMCVVQLYQCGNCLDDDGDGLIDAADPECWGPCNASELAFEPDVPADDGFPPCTRADCYFDLGTGFAYDDDCHWAFACDPLEPFECTFDPGTSIPGTGGATCAELSAAQSQQCLDTCLPITPNGCDCFGCCEVQLENDIVTIFLGSNLWGSFNTPCTLATADDPTICHPCTQNPACLNPCDTCELCLGKTTVPDGCTPAEQCENGEQPCGLPCQDPCPAGSFCKTGCCAPNP